MALPPEIPDPYLASFALGLLYGLTFCASACLPYVTSYIAGIGAGFRKGVMVTSIYNSGRVTAYALIGGLTGIFKLFVSDVFLFSFQKYSFFVFGIVIIIIGISILRKNRSSSCVCNVEDGKHLGLKKLTERFDIRAFSMGLTRGLVVCPPLIAILLYSITSSAPTDSLVLATLFGLGTTLSPLLLLGGVTGWLLNKAPLFSRWVSKIGAGILILLGLNMLVNAVI
ncbi:MAG: sulfite exporter TauE/SafE family protein [Candidatus Bathyarchaeota archaeon]|nr:sulfite exporter TauE/SafE family protein [Candidatus Bathyarchaeota archaeon]